MTGKIKLTALFLVSTGALALWVITPAGRAQSRPPGTVTFNKDVAPIVFQHCAECHHPGGSGPFELLTYQDVKKRARQVVAVTESRYMPPWLPEPSHGEIVGERRLTDDQIRLIGQWVEQGAVEGAARDLPPAPKFAAGWQLGPPDLVVKMSEAYVLPAAGADVFRNFVIPIPVTGTRYVKAVEVLPGNKKIVHHANILIDRTGSSRRRDERDPGVGFGGMDVAIESESFEPDSHFLFWKPGTPPYTEPDDMAWPLDRGTDLVLNMHLQPSGKPEVIQPVVGLYFADRPPTRFPMLLQLEHDGAIDIPPGRRDFVITDEFELPLDVDVLGVYPHAHYLGKELQGFATLPDGTRRWLIRIKDWDPNWQAVYRYSKPLFLPRGTILSMRYTYDNSAGNVRNPNQPPKRVKAGDKSSDEMAHLWVQVLPHARDDARVVLQEALMRQRLRKYPGDFSAHFNLGASLQSMGRLAEAISHFRQALRVKPREPVAHNNLGAALQATGELDEAVKHFSLALQLKPDYLSARYNLGNALLAQGKPQAAIPHFKEVLRVQPDDAGAHNSLGSALALQGDQGAAVPHFEEAVRLNPDHADAHHNLGKLRAVQGNLAVAVTHFEQVVRLKPGSADAHNDLGLVLAVQGDLARALAHFEQALRLDPQHAGARENLERARAQIRKN